MIGPTREGVIVKRAPAALQPTNMLVRAGSSSSNCTGRPVFLLHYHRTRPDMATADEITDANLHHIATAQLAVDGQIEQRPIT